MTNAPDVAGTTPTKMPTKMPTAVLRSADHNRGLNDVLATVEAMERPSDHLLRITARLSESTDDPTWSRPNVTVRMNLGPGFDDASRVYTVSSYDSASGSIVIDVVLHGQKRQTREGGQFGAGDLVICCDPADSDDVGRQLLDDRLQRGYCGVVQKK